MALKRRMATKPKSIKIRELRRSNMLRKGVVLMKKSDESIKLACLSDIKKMIQDSMKEKGITSVEARKSLGIKRYEK